MIFMQFLLVLLLLLGLYFYFIKPFIERIKSDGVSSALNKAKSDFVAHADKEYDRISRKYEQQKKEAERNNKNS